ncbi:protein of unknown function [Nitratireductor aquimarinus]
MLRSCARTLLPACVWPAGFQVLPDALQEHVQRFALVVGEAFKQRSDPFGVFVEQVTRRLLSCFGQADGDLPPVIKAAAAGDEAVAFEAIEKSGDGCAGHARTFRQLMRRTPLGPVVQEKKQDEFAFGKPVRREPGGAIAINRAGQCQQLETRADVVRGGGGAALGFVQQRQVFLFKHLIHMAAYNMVPNYSQ